MKQSINDTQQVFILIEVSHTSRSINYPYFSSELKCRKFDTTWREISKI